MSDSTRIATTAALLGDPTRANMLAALMDGRALTAKELAYAAHVSPQTTSGHLSKLTEAGLLTPQKQGRHRYYRLASPLVGQMLEGIMAVAGAAEATYRRGPAPGVAATLCARRAPATTTWLAVWASDWPMNRGAQGHVALTADGGEVTDTGHRFLRDFGTEPEPGRRVFCRPCLDWSERRPHIAGRLGAALACRCFELGWIERQRDTRAVAITAAGRAGFAERFGVAV